MSVLIKGMDMPNSCYDCQLAYDCMQCIVTGTSFFWEGEFRTVRKDFLPETDRLPDCPLVSVPTPHGDLIDRDDILKRLEMWLDHPSEYIRRRNNDMFTYLSDEEVVIESEE